MKKFPGGSIPVLICSEIGKLHSLTSAGIPVIVGSNYEENTALYSRYIKEKIHFPEYDTPDFIDALCEFGKQQPGKIVLMSDDDQAILTISRHREKLKDFFLFLLPERETVEIVQDKELFYKKAEELDLSIPTTFSISSRKELLAISDQPDFPCIVKPVSKEDWRTEAFQNVFGSPKKAFRCSSFAELMHIYEKIRHITPRVLVQELIEGPDHQQYSINMYIDQEDVVKGYYLYQKVRMFPPKAGRGCYLITVEDPEIIEKAKRISRILGMRGLVNIQFKKDQNGSVKLIEIEPRLSVSSFLGTAAGANVAEQYYWDLIGKKAPAFTNYRLNVKYFDPVRDLKASYMYWKQEELSLIDWLKSYRGTKVCNGYSWKDPFPVLISFWFIISSKLKK